MELSMILLVTKLFSLLSRKIHLPQVIGALLAGVILGPAILGFVEAGEVITTFAEIGVILLMFSAGLETDIKKLKESLRSSVIIATIGVMVPLGGGFVLAFCFGQNLLECIFIGLILTATSVSITVETLREMGKLGSKSGTAIMSVAIIDDILGIIILSVIVSLSGGGGISAAAVSLTLVKIAGFLVFALICGFGVYKIFKLITDKYGTHKRRLSIFSLAFCFFLAFLAEQFGVAGITGAYLAGLALCTSKAEEYLEQKVTTLSTIFFSPIFFVSVGLSASFDGLDRSTVLFAFLLLLIAILSKFAGCGLGARICKFTKRESIQIGAGMVSRGEVAIIVATKGMVAGLMTSSIFSSVIIVVVITTLVTPLFLKMAYNSKRDGHPTSSNPG